MFNSKKKQKLPESVSELAKEISAIKDENKKLREELEKVKKEQESCLQGMGLIRFNPFLQEGGNQSFSMALLDKKENGVVVTSLYTKEGNRVYGKPVKQGKSEYSLSEDEKKAIGEAKKGNCPH